MRKSLRFVAVWAAVVVLIAGCSGGGEDEAGLSVVATNSILGDVVSSIVGEDARLIVLTPLGVDPHEFRASAAQVAQINAADLVVANGLGLEEGLEDVLDAARRDGVRVIEIGNEGNALPSGDGSDMFDPHIWLDPILMAEAVDVIAAELSAVERSVDWAQRAAVYSGELEAVDTEIRELFAALPAENRRVVTNHDSLRYFALRYDLEVIGTVIPGSSSLSDPSSEEMANLVELMRNAGTTAVFAETTLPTALADAVAAELGDQVKVVSLYTGSVGEPGSGAETLVGMLRTNAIRMAEALGG